VQNNCRILKTKTIHKISFMPSSKATQEKQDKSMSKCQQNVVQVCDTEFEWGRCGGMSAVTGGRTDMKLISGFARLFSKFT